MVAICDQLEAACREGRLPRRLDQLDVLLQQLVDQLGVADALGLGALGHVQQDSSRASLDVARLRFLRRRGAELGSDSNFSLCATSTTPRKSSKIVELNLRFPGQYFDEESGLNYNVNRSCAAMDGRYTQGDPIGLNGGANRFSYMGGNPLSRVDPLGLWSFTFDEYYGVGWQVTFGNDNGNGFLTGRVGFGFGAGYSYDPNGGIPGPAVKDPSVGGIVLSDSAVANFSAGPVTGTFEKGFARNYSNGQSSWYGGPSATTSSPWWGGIRADASVGAQCTIYSGKIK